VGSVAEEGEGSRRMGPAGEFFADAEFPFADRLPAGEEFSYSFERVSMMMREEEKGWLRSPPWVPVFVDCSHLV